MSDEVKTQRSGSGQHGGSHAGARGVPVTLKKSVEIYPDSPFPKYDCGDLKAYEAVSRKSGSTECFAIICEPHLLPRVEFVERYSSFRDSSLMYLEEYGVVYWPPARAERYVLVYQTVSAKRLANPGATPVFGWRQEKVIDAFIKPLVAVFHMFKEKDFVHGNVRLDNLYYSEGGKGSSVVLGDCLSMPPSYAQPALYENPDRGMCLPLGRGMGTQADDLYAFGVVIAELMRGSNHLEGMSDDEIIRQKIEYGSYDVITGRDRFRGTILELLRGLLHDDTTQRWGIDQVQAWLDGNRLSPKQPVKPRKAPRAILFNDKKYYYPKFLAMDLHKNPSDVVRIVESEELQKWLERSVEDSEAVERLEKLLEESSRQGKGMAYGQRLAMNLSMILDLSGPLRYGGVSLMAPAFGRVLANAMMTGQELKPFADILSGTLIVAWIASREGVPLDINSLLNKFDNCRNYMRQGKVGFGLERCVYVLDQAIPCLSEKLRDYYVRTPEDMVWAFDDMCEKGDVPSRFLDRHSIAFLSVKDSKAIDSFLYDLGTDDEYKKALVDLKCFAIIQKRARTGPLVHLAKAFEKGMGVVYDRYHDRDVRDYLEKNIAKHANAGDLVKIAGLLDNVELLKKDRDGFQTAAAQYKALKEEAAQLEGRLQNKEKFGRVTGGYAAAFVSSVLAALIACAIGFMFFTGNLKF